MFSLSPTCSVCGKPIEKNKPIYVRMRYPSYRGMVEITAFLKHEGTIICKNRTIMKNERKLRDVWKNRCRCARVKRHRPVIKPENYDKVAADDCVMHEEGGKGLFLD
jgi:hypothetical protein